jgi:hypothetical protein
MSVNLGDVGRGVDVTKRSVIAEDLQFLRNFWSDALAVWL